MDTACKPCQARGTRNRGNTERQKVTESEAGRNDGEN
jgi:hypothetical protein